MNKFNLTKSYRVIGDVKPFESWPDYQGTVWTDSVIGEFPNVTEAIRVVVHPKHNQSNLRIVAIYRP